jgi:hypothetical protein
MWVEPGWLVKCLVLSALPAFLLEAVILNVLGPLGINQVWSFMISMPILIFAWFYFVSWLVDRWIFQRRHQVRQACLTRL